METAREQGTPEELGSDGEASKAHYRKDPVIKAHSADNATEFLKAPTAKQAKLLLGCWDDRRPILQTHRTDPTSCSISIPQQQQPHQQQQQQDSRLTASQDLLAAIPNSQELCKTISVQELTNKQASRPTPDLTKTRSCQDLPGKVPSKVSIQELDHFLTAIIQNLESQLKSGSSLSICSPRRASSTDEAKRRRWKKWEEEHASLIGSEKDKKSATKQLKVRSLEYEKTKTSFEIEEQMKVKEEKKREAPKDPPPKRYKR